MTDYRSGDTVRVTIEAMVEGHHIKYVQLPKSPDIDYLSEFHTVEITKRATPPEPTEIGAMVGVDLDAGPDDACVAIRLSDEPGSEWEISGSGKSCAWDYFVTTESVVTVLTPGGEA